MVVTNKGGILQNRFVYGVLSFIVNVIRSFPVIILIVFMLPMTKAIVGTSIGVAAVSYTHLDVYKRQAHWVSFLAYR